MPIKTISTIAIWRRCLRLTWQVVQERTSKRQPPSSSQSPGINLQAPVKKLQTPRSKLQRNFKNQAPTSKPRIGFPRQVDLCKLVLGALLEFGAWCLEFFPWCLVLHLHPDSTLNGSAFWPRHVSREAED